MLTAMLLAAAATAGADIAVLPAFMTGCWDLVEGDHWTQECWMEPKAGLMLGASREGSGAKLKSWEQLRIEQAPDGKITLYASPRGAAVCGTRPVLDRDRVHQRRARLPAAHPLRTQARAARSRDFADRRT